MGLRVSLTSLCLGLLITPIRRLNISISSGLTMPEFLFLVTLNVQRGFQTVVQDGAFDIKRSWPLGAG